MNMRHKGFSLVELMIAVAIVGILTAIVYPSYVSFSLKSYRSEAMHELVKVANMQEQYFADHRSYATALTKLGFSSDVATSESGKFQIKSEAVTDIKTDYILTATAVGAQTDDDDCASLSLDHLGQKTAKNSSGSDSTTICWGH